MAKMIMGGYGGSGRFSILISSRRSELIQWKIRKEGLVRETSRGSEPNARGRNGRYISVAQYVEKLVSVHADVDLMGEYLQHQRKGVVEHEEAEESQQQSPQHQSPTTSNEITENAGTAMPCCYSEMVNTG